MMIGIEWRGDTEPGAGVTSEAGDTNGAWGLLRARPGDIFRQARTRAMAARLLGADHLTTFISKISHIWLRFVFIAQNK